MKLLHSYRLYAVEKLTLIYILITFIVGTFIFLVNHYPVLHLLYLRLFISVLILGLVYLTSITRNKFTVFLRFMLIGILLVYWYPETFEFNRYFFNHDNQIARWEQNLFGFQPAYVFSRIYPQKIISELMNLGYFSYFPIIILTSLYFYFFDKKFFHPFFFILMFGFFLYYLIFILFPTTGPQYYFAVIGEKNILSGNFPSIGDFFRNHSIEPLKQQGGFFDSLVNLVQSVGERPTAAFPSSHVGISTLVMFMIERNKKQFLFFIILPLYILLVTSTVYIQAHYFVDVIAGFASAFLFYYIGKYFFNILS